MAKRVISYSLYGTNPLYVQGALRNVRMVPSIYPGWTPRVYVSQEVGPSDIDRLIAELKSSARSEPGSSTECFGGSCRPEIQPSMRSSCAIPIRGRRCVKRQPSSNG